MENISLLLEESVQYEMDAYEIYSVFMTSIQKDADFWEKLANEELDHAGLLKKYLSLGLKENEVYDIISVEDVGVIKDARIKIRQYLKEFLNNPSPDIARDIALDVENSIVENSYQKFMDSIPDTELKQIFHLLNGMEKDHTNRINDYFRYR
jgi:rubrerythrin